MSASDDNHVRAPKVERSDQPAHREERTVDARRSPANELRLNDAIQIARRLGPAGVLAAAACTLPFVGSLLLIGFMHKLGPWIRSHEAPGLVIYVVAFAACTGLALLNTWAPAILGGWAFGMYEGVVAALLGFVGGATIGYVIALRASGERVVRLIEEKPKWRAVHEALLGGGFARTLLIVTLMRLATSPFAITNLVFAATRVRWSVYVVGTLVGLTPRTAAAVYVGAGLSELDFSAGNQRWIWITGAVLTIGVVFIISHLASRAIGRMTARMTGPSEVADRDFPKS